MSDSHTDDELLEPLKIACTSTKCESDLHCFLRTKRTRETVPPGTCRSCGEQLVDMERVHDRDPADVQHTFESLRRELVRHHFWHKPFDMKALNYALRKGRAGLQIAAEQRIRSSVGKPANAFDGRQTSLEGNAIHYAQHAVAACCRRCMEEWHGIPSNRSLTEDEIQYFTKLILLYLDERLPDLPSKGQKIPAIRTAA